MSQPGLGAAKASSLTAILELARRAAEEQLMRPHTLSEPNSVKRYFRTALAHRAVEPCLALYLDNQLNLIASGELARVPLAQASVYPREVFRHALRPPTPALLPPPPHPPRPAHPHP